MDLVLATSLVSACDKCRDAPAAWHFAPRARLGSLYESPIAAQTPSEAALHLCRRCHADWMMEMASFGYDIHSHDLEHECGSGCYTRQNSRYVQHQAMLATTHDRRRAFLLTKRHDSMPGVNGTSLLASARTGHFLAAGYNRQTFYESVGDHETLLQLISSSDGLVAQGLPRHMADRSLVAFEIFEGVYNASQGEIQLPMSGERSLGLHAVAAERYRTGPGGGLEFWNSWGSGWGRKGYGFVSTEYLMHHFREAWVFRRGRWGPSQHKKVFLAESPDPRVVVRAWEVQNPRISGRFWGSWKTYEYDSISPIRECVVEVAEARNGIGIRAAWVFVYHDLDPETDEPFSEITELFVWPIFRRAGLGTALERWASDRARSYGSREIRLVYNESDNSPSPLRTAGRLFGPARGYEWRWRERVGPRAVATGYKSL
jgi:GNAT superfamily N-acetyltransferase